MTPSGNQSGADQRSITRHEERLRLGKDVEEIGTVRLRRQLETGEVSTEIPRGIEHAQVHHAPPGQSDSGEVETLPDGSISIPVLEEELVISRRLIVRERIVIKKQTVYQPEHVTEEVRRERIEVERLGDSAPEDPVVSEADEQGRTERR